MLTEEIVIFAVILALKTYQESRVVQVAPSNETTRLGLRLLMRRVYELMAMNRVSNSKTPASIGYRT